MTQNRDIPEQRKKELGAVGQSLQDFFNAGKPMKESSKGFCLLTYTLKDKSTNVDFISNTNRRHVLEMLKTLVMRLENENTIIEKQIDIVKSRIE